MSKITKETGGGKKRLKALSECAGQNKASMKSQWSGCGLYNAAATLWKEFSHSFWSEGVHKEALFL